MVKFSKSKHSTFLIFIILVILFGVILNLEYQRTVNSQKESLNIYLDHLKEEIDRLLNERLYNLRGFIPYIQLNPDLSQEAFENYAKLLLSEDDVIIKDIVLMRDTTVTHFYPVEGNEAIMGVDIAKVDIWNEKVLLAKNEGETVIDGPYKIIEGGMGIICRIPFDYSPEEGQTTYYGIMNYVVNYDVFLERTGLSQALEDYHLRIEQVNQVDQSELIIASNHQDFKEDAVTHVLQLPNTLWKFTIEYKDGYNGFSLFFKLLGILAVLVIGFSFISVDTIIKSKEALELSLNQLKQAQDKLILSEKLATLGDLTANVAHEINTPLGNSISLTSHIHKRHEDVKEKFENDTLTLRELTHLFDTSISTYERMNKNLNRIVYLVDDFKRLTSSGQVSELKFIELDSFVLNVLEELNSNEIHPIAIEHQLESIRLFTDPVALRNTINNLFRNSIAHGFKDRSDNIIYIQAKEIKNTHEVLLEYWDNGVGFKEEALDHVFTPFYSTKKHEGHSGLGLHIVYNAVVNVLGGSIDIVKNNDHMYRIQIRFKEIQQR